MMIELLSQQCEVDVRTRLVVPFRPRTIKNGRLDFGMRGQHTTDLAHRLCRQSKTRGTHSL